MSEQQEFKVGDVVRLKSGGPAMTVSGRKSSHGLVPVEWFVAEIIQRDAFEPEMLMKMSQTEMETALDADAFRRMQEDLGLLKRGLVPHALGTPEEFQHRTRGTVFAHSSGLSEHLDGKIAEPLTARQQAEMLGVLNPKDKPAQ